MFIGQYLSPIKDINRHTLFIYSTLITYFYISYCEKKKKKKIDRERKKKKKKREIEKVA
jgi:hypothetical protein